MADETTGALAAAQIGVQSALDVLEAQGHFGTHADFDCKACNAIHRLDTARVQIRLVLEARAQAADPTRTPVSPRDIEVGGDHGGTAKKNRA